MFVKHFDIVITCLIVIVHGLTVIHTYSLEGEDRFRNFVVDQDGENIFIGGERMLYKLNFNLDMEEKMCTLREKDCSAKGADNANQVLLYHGSGLITCGTAGCELRHLSNLSTIFESSDSSIVSNTPMVAFISELDDWDVCYMAKSHKKGQNPKSPLNIIALRHFVKEKTFEVVEANTIKLEIVLRDSTDISLYYRSGFSHGTFNYFFTNQKAGADMDYISKLAQVCKSDSDYLSYIDLPIVCQSDGQNYTLLQDAALVDVGPELEREIGDQKLIAAVFTLSGSSRTSSNAKSSAVCLYSFKDVQEKMLKVLEYWVVNDTCEEDHLYLDSECPSVTEGKYFNEHAKNDDGSLKCPSLETWNRVIGFEPLIAQAIHHSADRNVTTIRGQKIGDYTSLYMGTDDGRLVKLLLNATNEQSVLYDTINISSSPIKAISSVDEVIYILTENEIRKNSTNCSQYSTCSECVTSRDPVCGWCVSKNRCSSTFSGECPPDHWLPAAENKCLSMTMAPKEIAVTKAKNITITLSHKLDDLIGKFECKFGDKDPFKPAVENGHLICEAPPSTSRHFIEVAILYDGFVIAKKDLKYFDCSSESLTSCRQCYRESNICRWCVSHGCAEGNTGNCDSWTEKMSDCPQLESTTKYLPEDASETLEISGNNFTFLLDSNTWQYSCAVTGFDGTVNATLDIGNNTLMCGAHKYKYNDDKGWIEGGISVSYSINTPKKQKTFQLDYEQDTEAILQVYKCQQLHKDCSTCLSPNDHYNCLWCQNGCQSAHECTSPADRCPRPFIESIDPKSGLKDGGTLVTIQGTELGSSEADVYSVLIGDVPCVLKDFTVSKRIICETEKTDTGNAAVRVNISGQSNEDNGVKFFYTKCNIINDEEAICRMPKKSKNTRRKREVQNDQTLIIKMDGFTQNVTVKYVIDPTFFKFSEPDFIRQFTPAEGVKLVITGKNLTLAATSDDVEITIGGVPCDTVVLDESEVSCSPKEQPGREEENLNVTVKVGYIDEHIGYLKYNEESTVLYIIIAVLCSVLVVSIIVFVLIYKRFIKKKDAAMEELELEIKKREQEMKTVMVEEFVNLVDCEDMTGITSELVKSGLPFNSFQNYVFHILFPSDKMENHPLLQDPVVTDDERAKLQNAMPILEQLLFNKFFLAAVVSALGKQKRIQMKEKAEFCSVLTLILMEKMDYFAELIKLLVTTLVEESLQKKQQKTLFRRLETMSEKLLSFWISISMYSHVKLHAGSPLFMLYKATQILMESSPTDAITNDAKFTLMEGRILTTKQEPEKMTLDVQLNKNEYPCKVLHCDTVTQVKHKCLSAIYKNMPASQQPTADEIDLEWHEGKNGKMTLKDIDETSERELGWTRHNTMMHYMVKDKSKMALLAKLDMEEESDQLDPDYVNSPWSLHGTSPEAVHVKMNEEEELLGQTREWHLVKPHESDTLRTAPREMMEVYLPRLLNTKHYLMQYIQDFYNMIVKSSEIPPCVKYLYDLLDELAIQHSIDSSVLHSWKSQSYVIRYWTTMVNKPDLLFDIHKKDYVESCMNVVGQILIDACSTTPPKYGRNSPMHKVLFKKEIAEYQQQVKSFFKNVGLTSHHNSPSLVDKMIEQSKMFSLMLQCNKMAALFKVYKVIDKYMADIVSELEDDPKTQHLQLGNKLESVQAIMNGEV
ncbi:hypothetical protein ScPMuIL_007792 [Solemya velum]